MSSSMPIACGSGKGVDRKPIAHERVNAAKADIRDLFPEACKRLAYQVRMTSSEAGRKEWGTTQAAALEALIKYDLYPLLLKTAEKLDDHEDRLRELEYQTPRRTRLMRVA